jgi:hypothetical protein
VAEDRDDAIGTAEDAARSGSGAGSLFDIRSVIGGLFLLYGVVLLVAGLVDGDEASEKAAGIDINIWTGIGMAAFGVLMLAWMRVRPVAPAAGRDEDDHATRRS